MPAGGTATRPPRPSGYVQSWLAKGSSAGDGKKGDPSASHSAETVEHLERDLLDLNDAEVAPKNAGKDLAQRVLPRLCAHGVPGPNSLEVLTRMLADGACPERFALRYAYYLIHRILEHYGRTGLATNEAVKAATSQCIKTLGEEAKSRAGVRRMLATRALVAAARSGVPEAAGALHQGTVGAVESLNAGENPRGKSSMFDSKTGKTEGGDAAHTDAAARAALGARRRFIAGSEEGDKKADSAIPGPNALAAAVRSPDHVAARHALSLALAAAKGPKYKELASALEPVIGAVAKRMEAKAANLEAVAAAGDSKEAKAMARKGEGKQKGEPNLEDPGAEPLLLRLCGALRARLLGAAERGGGAHNCAWACEKVLAAELKTYGGAAAGSESSPRVAMAACAGLFGMDAPPGADGAKARAATWRAIVRGGGEGGEPRLLANAAARMKTVLLDPDSGPVARSAACRAVSALGEARVAARAVSGRDRAGQDGSLASLAAALKVAAGAQNPPGVRVEALRALLWLQTPDFLTETTSIVAEHLAHGMRYDDGITDESFVGNTSGSRPGGKSLEGPFDARNRLLTAAAQRCALGCAGEDEDDQDAWLTLTADTVTAIVGSNARQCAAEPTLDALRAAQRGAPKRSKPAVSSLAANLAAIARAQDAPTLEAALTWHLGENANYCAGEYAWVADTDGAVIAAVDVMDPDEAPGPGASCAAAARNPSLASSISTLQRILMTSPDWPTRAAAVQALTTVSVRSGEPFRLQCYAALRGLQRVASADPTAAAGPPALAHEIDAAVTMLDHAYRAKERFAAMLADCGSDPLGWSPGVLAEVTGRSEVVTEIASRICFLPRSKYLPLGPSSAPFIDRFKEMQGADRVGDAAVAAAKLMGQEAEKAAAQRRRRVNLGAGVANASRRKGFVAKERRQNTHSHELAPAQGTGGLDHGLDGLLM